MEKILCGHPENSTCPPERASNASERGRAEKISDVFLTFHNRPEPHMSAEPVQDTCRTASGSTSFRHGPLLLIDFPPPDTSLTYDVPDMQTPLTVAISSYCAHHRLSDIVLDALQLLAEQDPAYTAISRRCERRRVVRRTKIPPFW